LPKGISGHGGTQKAEEAADATSNEPQPLHHVSVVRSFEDKARDWPLHPAAVRALDIQKDLAKTCQAAG
jgi:hypothetical protein